MTEVIMEKLAYHPLMSREVSDDEKRIAKKVIKDLSDSVNLLDKASTYLNQLKTSMKDNPTTDPKAIMDARVFFRNFRDQAIDNFNAFKLKTLDVIDSIESFTSDTELTKIKTAFISGMADLQTKVNEDFVPIFDDLKNKDFASEVVKRIEAVQNECEDLKNLMNGRIKHHVDINILKSNWLSQLRESLNRKVQQKKPILIELFNQRQEELNKMVKHRGSIK